MVTRAVPGDVAQLVVHLDGCDPLGADTVARLAAVCDRVEDLADAVVVAHLTGAPTTPPAGLTIATVSRWERLVRRFERLPAATVAVATGDCGGPALDLLLAADQRILATGATLRLSVHGDAVWPGMALYRLARHAAHAAAVRRAVLFGDAVRAADALAAQLVDRVTDDVAAATADAARSGARCAGPDLAIRRQLLTDAAGYGFDDALGVHLAACDRLLRRAAPPLQEEP